jgi:hypothetical protein
MELLSLIIGALTLFFVLYFQWQSNKVKIEIEFKQVMWTSDGRLTFDVIAKNSGNRDMWIKDRKLMLKRKEKSDIDEAEGVSPGILAANGGSYTWAFQIHFRPEGRVENAYIVDQKTGKKHNVSEDKIKKVNQILEEEEQRRKAKED